MLSERSGNIQGGEVGNINRVSSFEAPAFNGDNLFGNEESKLDWDLPSPVFSQNLEPISGLENKGQVASFEPSVEENAKNIAAERAFVADGGFVGKECKGLIEKYSDSPYELYEVVDSMRGLAS